MTRLYLNLAALQMLAAAIIPAQTWLQLSPANAPSPRYGHSMAYDARHKQTVLFGGYNGASLGDTWLWDGTNWTLQSPSTGPSPREYSALSYDAAHGVVVLFGGLAGNVAQNDTWTWDGTTWTQQFPSASPPTLTRHCLAYDQLHQQVVLFGGAQQGIFESNQTWIWNGTTWAIKSVSNPPPARYWAGMDYDSVHSQMVLFGGFNSSGETFNDTWIWGGTTWTQASPTAIPPARWGSPLAYDSATAQMVMFSGSESFFANDTWTWNGTNWTQLSPKTSPTGRQMHAMVFEAATSQILLFGGQSLGQLDSDTWVWGGGSLTFPVPYDKAHCKGGTCTPQTVNISSVFDHQMNNPYESPEAHTKSGCVPKSKTPPMWGEIMDFLGEEANANPDKSRPFGACLDLYGYTSSISGTTFLSGYHLLSPTYLYYDGHPGYDYPFYFTTGQPLTGVYPAISGCVSYSVAASANQTQALYHTLAIIPMSAAPPNKQCPSPLPASETGFAVFYLHLANYLGSDGKTIMVCPSPPNAPRSTTKTCPNAVVCTNCPAEGMWVSTDSSVTTQPIAYVGNFSNGAWGAVGPHLHFEVDYLPTPGAKPVPLDPYGWNPLTPGTPDPYAPPTTAPPNVWLWNSPQ